MKKKMNLDEAKSIFASKTFWGAIVTILATLDPNLIIRLTMAQSVSDAQTILVAKCIVVSGAVLTIYGRFAVKQIVTLTGKPPQPTIEDLLERINILELDVEAIKEEKPDRQLGSKSSV